MLQSHFLLFLVICFVKKKLKICGDYHLEPISFWHLKTPNGSTCAQDNKFLSLGFLKLFYKRNYCCLVKLTEILSEYHANEINEYSSYRLT